MELEALPLHKENKSKAANIHSLCYISKTSRDGRREQSCKRFFQAKVDGVNRCEPVKERALNISSRNSTGISATSLYVTSNAVAS